MKIKHYIKSSVNKFVFVALFSLLFAFCLIGCAQNQIKTSYHDEGQITGLKHFDNYQLTQSTIVSRHDLRSAIDEPGTPYINDTSVEFQKWTSDPGELTLKGGELETLYGQYFRKYYVSENLMNENWIPANDEAYFYSNSNQRTIATANYFSRGLLPLTNINIVHKFDIGKDDPVFSRKITKGSQAYQDQFYKEVKENNNGNDFDGILQSLSSNMKKMEDFLGFKNSKYAKDNGLDSFPLDNTTMDLTPGVGPKMKGTFKTANEIVDAFKMQYYEVEDDSLALFGKNISYKDILDICEIDNSYQKSIFSNHTHGVDRSNLLLKEIDADINNANRKVTFLSGHDNTLQSLLAALRVKDYRLPNTLGATVPIGAKIVFDKFVKDGQEYCDISMVYLTVDQIRHRYALSLDNPPMAVPLQFDGIERNSDGLFKMSDVYKIINETIGEYDNWQ